MKDLVLHAMMKARMKRVETNVMKKQKDLLHVLKNDIVNLINLSSNIFMIINYNY